MYSSVPFGFQIPILYTVVPSSLRNGRTDRGSVPTFASPSVKRRMIFFLSSIFSGSSVFVARSSQSPIAVHESHAISWRILSTVIVCRICVSQFVSNVSGLNTNGLPAKPTIPILLWEDDCTNCTIACLALSIRFG